MSAALAERHLAGHALLVREGAGSEPPLLLLHGFTGAASSWERFVAFLPEERGVIAVSLPGHGSPAHPARGFRGALAGLAALLCTLELPRVELVGYSLGGRLGLGLTLEHPELVERATLVGAHPGLSDDAARAERRERDAALARRIEEQGLESFVAFWEALPLFASQAALPPERLAAQRAQRLAHDPAGLAAALRQLGLAGMPDYNPRLAACPRPLRLVAGERDSKFLALARAAAERSPVIQAVSVPGVGHNALFEDPRALARLVLEPWT